MCTIPPPDDITQSDPQVVADHPVHSNFFIRACIIRQYNAHSLASLFALHQYCVTTEELQFIHLGLEAILDRFDSTYNVHKIQTALIYTICVPERETQHCCLH